MWEVTREAHGHDQALLWARAAWAGSQRYPVHWSGDGVARFEDLACVLRSALSFGMSGFPFYSHDIGGFSGIPSPELYVRWTQFGLFSSHARCHGEPPREPWAYGKAAEDIFRQYAELRYRLIPYIYSQAVECGKNSLPMVRALVLAFQDDPGVALIFDQYLFGESILVAPILDETNLRRVYLPPGTWVDYWTKKSLQGPAWISIQAPLEVLPLYIRGGAILPYGPLCQYIDQKPLDPLTLEIYAPEPDADFRIYDPDHTDIQIKYHFNGNNLILETSSSPGRIDVILYGMEIKQANLGEENLEVMKTENGGWQYSYDGRMPARVTLFT
jgi:alpha-D-xyloside xylohydrolase